ncbi:probable mitochondrial import inner membrane translocase subunit TIM21 [Durio zibethinus]|uniref:Mitochondrial import inner membrane translocase subunit Tim21 n=1 Tax=Durio zibethinus TaxID=66656 RepID=A0A6P5ZW32_DURZI|nr:probable mitochondrial import inner membrane translocase subunit TIM21 [Durio zibethinus]XP_022756948.1 probable mitochondrial import inner membrane translocase subunit TIM21 [Durio zibethinus]XP_022756949.1 probable mitochondrial import inner membrane translocase subunit TIM21 [Durio zibethinus]XP_022756950.1 probable mitochondrial import inner membrane translocase subunit TIM21 [Durio zibethinus]XP_022756951.1 probable mitochondrial import inner membrane translocase subunit TIM21 [Durio zi
MQNIRRSVISSSGRWGGLVRSFVESKPCLDGFSSPAKRFPADLNSSFTRRYVTGANNMSKGVLGANGIALPFKGQCGRDSIVSFQASVPHIENYGSKLISPCFARSFASRASKQSKETSETRKELSNVEDPFDAPTYNIPEKPVTFTEGASYSIIILVGLGIAAAAAYAVFMELIFQPKEYKIFNHALERIQNESQVRVRIGHPITGYGQESRNRAARQRIPNRIYTDENGVEHVEINFYIRGPHGAGKVFTEMFKDKTDNKWKYTYLIVQINSPSPAELMLESYLPAAELKSSAAN